MSEDWEGVLEAQRLKTGEWALQFTNLVPRDWPSCPTCRRDMPPELFEHLGLTDDHR
jgi:hypothetical protein